MKCFVAFLFHEKKGNRTRGEHTCCCCDLSDWETPSEQIVFLMM